MYRNSLLEEERREERKLPKGEEFEALCQRLKEKKIEEKTKIALAGRYFAQHMEEEYEAVAKLIVPRSEEEHMLRNNQEILVSLVRYQSTHKKLHLERAQELSEKTVLFLPVKTLLLLLQEKSKEQILEEGYKLDRECKYSALIKGMAFIYAKKHKNAISVLSRHAEMPEALLLCLLAEVLLEESNTSKTYNKLCAVIKEKTKQIRGRADLSDSVKKKKTDSLEQYQQHADSLVGSGPKTGYDKDLEEIEQTVQHTSGGVLTTLDQLVKDNAQDPAGMQEKVHSSKKLRLGIELVLAKALYSKKRYAEALRLVEKLKHAYLGQSESTDEEISLLLLLLHLHTKTLHRVGGNMPGIINALTKCSAQNGGSHIFDLIELIKRKQPVPPSFDEAEHAWIEKMLALSETKLFWRVEIEKARYLNRLGNLCFFQKNLLGAKEAYTQALSMAKGEDKEQIKENLNTLEKWMGRPETPAGACPECQVLQDSQRRKDISPSEAPSLADQLEEIAETIAKLRTKDETSHNERLISIFSLCALLRFQKPILTVPEVADSSVSVIHNHVVFWIQEGETIDQRVIEKAIEQLRNKHSTSLQRNLSKKTVEYLLGHFTEQKNLKWITHILAEIEPCLTDKEKKEKAVSSARQLLIEESEMETKLKLELADPKTQQEGSPQKRSKQENSTDKAKDKEQGKEDLNTAESFEKSSLSQLYSTESALETEKEAELANKRDEVLKLLMEMQDKKQKAPKHKAETKSQRKKRSKVQEQTETEAESSSPASQPPSVQEETLQKKALAQPHLKKRAQTIESSEEE
ncbi:hypothetical protein NECID01_1328 [Nematocida sp. AWRm77]|nr:hypothetical protein NECID01_1328 [Nematocida sp. AWRm77]